MERPQEPTAVNFYLLFVFFVLVPEFEWTELADTVREDAALVPLLLLLLLLFLVLLLLL